MRGVWLKYPEDTTDAKREKYRQYRDPEEYRWLRYQVQLSSGS